MQADKKEIIKQADYIHALTERLLKAAKKWESNTHASGTIHNLTAEVSKEASELRKMARLRYTE